MAFRKVFQSMQLLRISRSSGGRFTPGFATTQFALFYKLTGSVQTPAIATVNTVLHGYKHTSKEYYDTAQP